MPGTRARPPAPGTCVCQPFRPSTTWSVKTVNVFEQLKNINVDATLVILYVVKNSKILISRRSMPVQILTLEVSMTVFNKGGSYISIKELNNF